VPGCIRLARLTVQCSELADRWDRSRGDERFDGFSPADVASFLTTQIGKPLRGVGAGADASVVFLDALRSLPPLPPAAVRALDAKYAFGASANAEIRFRFLAVGLQSGAEYAQAAADWVADKGRMKFCRPIYRLLHARAPALARRTFAARRSFYHPIARRMIAADLGLD